MFVVLGLLITLQSFAQTLHLIIVQDDTDPTIGGVVDFNKVQKFAQNIANTVGMRYKVYPYKKSEYLNNADKLNADLKSLSYHSDDVVWFYYTGHGFNSGDGNLFTGFSLGTGTNAMNYKTDYIHQRLTEKEPRLTIVMTDACNYSQIPGYNTAPSGGTASRAGEGWRKLFLESKGYIKVASNTAGYRSYSYGDATNGGLFTRGLLDVLKENEENVNTNWQNVLNQTTTKVSSQPIKTKSGDIVKQTPYFKQRTEIITRPLENQPNTPGDPAAKNAN